MGLKERREAGGAERLVALVGNPNVGKSTLFNALTGLRQHTGNWPGKTVELAQGTFAYKAETYRLVDLPGTYSLQNCSKEEKVTTDFLEQEAVSCTLAVCDATNLERSLLLVLEVLETADRVMVCVNLMDEAERSGISLDLRRLEAELGVPVVGVAAAQKEGLESLRERLRSICDGFERPHPRRLGLRRAENQRQAEGNIRRLAGYAAELAGKCMRSPGRQGRTEKIDRFVTGKVSGPILFCMLLFAVLWLTVSGANVFSDVLESAFAFGIDRLHRAWSGADWPEWLGGLLLDGILGTTTKVTAVMLPPVMIFFPLFTLLEDVGYLPRVAYLLDAPLAHCGGCGRQALTMCMGLGCNAAGVMGCRIIGSERERLLAILTNSFMPCNGRFPLLIALGGYLFAGQGSSLEAAVCLTFALLFSVWATMAANMLLSRTVLRGKASEFIMELPPYRRANAGKVLTRSVADRVGYVLVRAVSMAAPAGALIWALSRITVDGVPVLKWMADWIDPAAGWFGLSGGVLLAFVLAWPANELVFPLLVLIGQMGGGFLQSGGEMGMVFTELGWSRRTALCAMILCLFHWPCSTTVLTIRKETGSWKWTLLAVTLPTLIGLTLCRWIALI